MPIYNRATSGFVRYLEENFSRVEAITATAFPGESAPALVAQALINTLGFVGRQLGHVGPAQHGFVDLIVGFFESEREYRVINDTGQQFFERVLGKMTRSELRYCNLDRLRVFELLSASFHRDASAAMDQNVRMLRECGTRFVEANGSLTDTRAAALIELERVLSGETKWSVEGIEPENRELFEEIHATVEQLQPAIEYVAQRYPIVLQHVPDTKDILPSALEYFLFSLVCLIGPGGAREAAFCRDFRWVFECKENFSILEISFWIRWVQSLCAHSTAATVELTFPEIDLLQEYDQQASSDSAGAVKAVIFRLANAFAKADGTVNDTERAVLSRIKETLYPPVAVAVTSTASAETAKPKGVELLPNAPENLPALIQELQSLIGLQNVKSDVSALVNFLRVQKMREERGMKSAVASRHLVFSGNPGTGKTTIARLLSRIYNSLGILSKGHLVETERSGLVAGYLGQTAIKTKDVVDKATGGVLFIDEAYALKERDDDSFGQEAIDTLLKFMEDRRDDLVVVVAGYTQKMNDFLSANPGMQSRFNKYIAFADYSPGELLSIFHRFANTTGFRLAAEADMHLLRLFTVLYEKRSDTFGNGRLARNIFEMSISNQANRIVALANVDESVLSTIEADDIPALNALPRIL